MRKEEKHLTNSYAIQKFSAFSRKLKILHHSTPKPSDFTSKVGGWRRRRRKKRGAFFSDKKFRIAPMEESARTFQVFPLFRLQPTWCHLQTREPVSKKTGNYFKTDAKEKKKNISTPLFFLAPDIFRKKLYFQNKNMVIYNMCLCVCRVMCSHWKIQVSSVMCRKCIETMLLAFVINK